MRASQRRAKMFHCRMSKDEFDVLCRIMDWTGESKSALVRRMVFEEARRVESVVTRLERRESEGGVGG